MSTASRGSPRAPSASRSPTRRPTPRRVLRAGARLRGRGRRRRAVPRAAPVRLLDRGPAACRTPCSTRVEAALATVVEGSARPAARARRRRAAAPPQPPLQLRGRHPPRPGARRRARSPTCRPTASSTSAASSRPATTSAAARSASAAPTCPFGPDLLFAAEDVPGPRRPRRGLRGRLGPDPAELRGGARRRDRAAEPLGQPDHGRPRRGPQAAVPVAVARAASPPTSTPRPARASRRTDLSWDGQTMIYENGALLAETERFPDGDAPLGRRRRPRPAAPGADADGDVRRQPPHPRRAASTRSAASPSQLEPPDRRPRPAAHRRALPVRARRPRAARAGLLRGLQHPGRRPASSGWRRSATRRSSSASPAASTRRTR